MVASKDYVGQPNSLSYIDLLVNMLMRHEKNLNRLIERLEKVSTMLDKVAQRIAAERKKKERLSLIYV